ASANEPSTNPHVVNREPTASACFSQPNNRYPIVDIFLRDLTINVSTMANSVDHHLTRLIVNGVKDPIVTDSQSIGFLVLKFLDASWTGIAFKLQKTLIDTFLSLGRKGRQLLFGGTLDQNPVSHRILWMATTRIF